VSGPAGGGGRPRLAAVPPLPAEPVPPGPREARDGKRRWVWVLAAALALTLGALAVEARRAGQLSERLVATEARLVDTQIRLDSAEARLAAYDGYLAAVRSRASSLRLELEGLAGLLAADPAEGAPPK
jgi:hypothetical protein